MWVEVPIRKPRLNISLKYSMGLRSEEVGGQRNPMKVFMFLNSSTTYVAQGHYLIEDATNMAGEVYIWWNSCGIHQSIFHSRTLSTPSHCFHWLVFIIMPSHAYIHTQDSEENRTISTRQASFVPFNMLIMKLVQVMIYYNTVKWLCLSKLKHIQSGAILFPLSVYYQNDCFQIVWWKGQLKVHFPARTWCTHGKGNKFIVCATAFASWFLAESVVHCNQIDWEKSGTIDQLWGNSTR